MRFHRGPKRELHQEGVHRPAILARAFINLTMQGLHSLLAPVLVFELFGIHKSFSSSINRNRCANIRQLGKSLDRNREFPYFVGQGCEFDPALRLDSSRNALSHRCDITAKNLADFAQLGKEHVMVAALYLAVMILIQPAFCR